MQSTQRPEYLRPKDIPKFFGIGRSKAYELIAAGKVKSVSLRQRGQKHGTRLVSYDSLAAYLESLASGGDVFDQKSPQAETAEAGSTHPTSIPT
jgi:hypothetical protein